MIKQPGILFVTLLFLGSCGNNRSTDIEEQLPGIYVREITNEFTTGMDTLVVDILDPELGTYKIIKRSSYQQTIDGKVLSQKAGQDEWIAIFDEMTLQLRVQNKERLLTVLEGQNKLMLGSTEYFKVSTAK